MTDTHVPSGLVRRSDGVPRRAPRLPRGRPKDRFGGPAVGWVAPPFLFRGDRATNAFNTVAWWSLAIAVCLVLGLRRIGVTWDDPNYLENFTRQNLEYVDWYHWLIDEPVWNFLTLFLSSFLDARTAYRVVLMASPACFLLSLNKIAGGRWLAVGLHSWLILAGFVLDGAIGAQLYIAAIRQGFATSIFLLGAALRRPLLGALVAGTIHTALLIIGGVVGLAQALRRNKGLALVLLAGMAVGALLLAEGILPSPFRGLDMGRRAGEYVLATGLNLTGYLVQILVYGLALILCRRFKSQWLTMFAVFLPLSYALSVANPAMIRILLDLDVLILVALCPAARSRRGLVAIGYFFVATMALSLWGGRDDISGRSSWLGLWRLALGG